MREVGTQYPKNKFTKKEMDDLYRLKEVYINDRTIMIQNNLKYLTGKWANAHNRLKLSREAFEKSIKEWEKKFFDELDLEVFEIHCLLMKYEGKVRSAQN
jgi:hypothetical protein